MNEDALDANLANWGSRLPVHVAGHGLERFLEDPSHLSDVVRYDAPAPGDLAGQRVAHLQYHIDTNPSARLGDDVVGVEAAGEERRAGQRRLQDPPVFTDAELRVSPEGWAASQDAASALGELVHRQWLPCCPVDAVPISATIARFEMGGSAS